MRKIHRSTRQIQNKTQGGVMKSIVNKLTILSVVLFGLSFADNAITTVTSVAADQQIVSDKAKLDKDPNTKFEDLAQGYDDSY